MPVTSLLKIQQRIGHLIPDIGKTRINKNGFSMRILDTHLSGQIMYGCPNLLTEHDVQQYYP